MYNTLCGLLEECEVKITSNRQNYDVQLIHKELIKPYPDAQMCACIHAFG